MTIANRLLLSGNEAVALAARAATPEVGFRYATASSCRPFQLFHAKVSVL
jgi:hypothetical protein